VHQVLTREAYAGTHYFNRTEAKRKRGKEKAEWVAFETPVIIDPEVFHAVQKMLEARRPTRVPPRVVTGPTLLTGLVRCETCGGGMTIRTGKGGRYRYYTCNNRVNEGPTSCKGRNIPMQVLDSIIIDNLEDRILAPERLEPMLKVILDRARNRTSENAAKAKELRKKLRGTEGKIERLFAALAEGTVGDTDMFRRSMALVEAERDEVLHLIAALEKHRDVPRHLLTKRNIERFATAARARLRNENARLRKGYMRQLISRIEVGDRQIRVSGPESALANGVMDSGSGPAAGVPSFVQGWWRTQSQSNPSPLPNSLLTGKRTGNFVESSRAVRF
jgi:site-specific DNA recombinase